MREIKYDDIVEAVANLCKQACCIVTPDMKEAFRSAAVKEISPLGKDIISKIIQNGKIAEEKHMPICQDTGMSVVFLEVGQDVHVIGGYIEDAINDGIAKGYTEGYLRKSVVNEPIYERKNTGDNTPAVINTRIIKGDKIRIKVAPKGFGSENKSMLKMLVPADGLEGVKKLFLEAVKYAGPNSCPPLVIGVGIGGTMDKAALLAKIAAVREVDSKNPILDMQNLKTNFLNLQTKPVLGLKDLAELQPRLK